MKNSFFATVKHGILLRVSASYRRREELKRGESIWNELNGILPAAVGATENDIPRLQEFCRIISSYPPEKWLLLRKWLLQEYDDTERLCPEMLSGREEEYFARRRQILGEHLEAMVNGAPHRQKS